VICCIGFAAYTANFLNEEERKYWTPGEQSVFANATKECLQGSDVGSPQIDMTKLQAAYDKCLYEAHLTLIFQMVALNFGVVVLGWLAGWLRIVVVRRIKNSLQWQRQ
jgi:hypothetical protein